MNFKHEYTQITLIFQIVSITSIIIIMLFFMLVIILITVLGYMYKNASFIWRVKRWKAEFEAELLQIIFTNITVVERVVCTLQRSRVHDLTDKANLPLLYLSFCTLTHIYQCIYIIIGSKPNRGKWMLNISTYL